MLTGTLRSYCLTEVVRLTALYLSGLLAFIVVSFSAPFLQGGAPLDAVLGTIDSQILFALPYVLPLSYTAAILCTVGRIRAEGELIALRSSGISASSLFTALIPLTILLCLCSAYISNVIQPKAMLGIRTSKAALLQQSIASSVARKEPIFSNRGNDIYIVGSTAVDNHVNNVIMYDRQPNDAATIMYTPRAQWTFSSEEEAFALELVDGRVLFIPNTAKANDLDTPAAINLPTRFRPWLPEEFNAKAKSKADTLPTSELAAAEQAMVPILDGYVQAQHDHHDRGYQRARFRYRRLQMLQHQRIIDSVSPILYTLIACTLALVWPTHIHVLAIMVAFAIFIPVSLAGQIIVASSGSRLTFHPAWIMWPLFSFLTIASAFLFWRKR